MINQAIQSGIIEPEALHQLLNISTFPEIKEEIKEHLPSGAQIKIIDGTFVLPTSTEKPYQSFSSSRIPSAIFFDIDEIADKNTDLPHMLPSPSEFEHAMSRLGISNDDFVVIYGQSGMVMGPARIWWTFRCFGHENVCVLNGALPAWKAAKLPLETASPLPITATKRYTANLKQNLVKNLEDMQKIAQEGHNALILDARPEGRFNGTVPEPRADLRSGHMPNSQNLPCVKLICSETGKLKSKKELNEILPTQIQSTTPTPRIITTCGSGVTACMITLAFYHLGYKKTAVYDGSWAEWGQNHLQTRVLTAKTP